MTWFILIYFHINFNRKLIKRHLLFFTTFDEQKQNTFSEFSIKRHFFLPYILLTKIFDVYSDDQLVNDQLVLLHISPIGPKYRTSIYLSNSKTPQHNSLPIYITFSFFSSQEWKSTFTSSHDIIFSYFLHCHSQNILNEISVTFAQIKILQVDRSGIYNEYFRAWNREKYIYTSIIDFTFLFLHWFFNLSGCFQENMAWF